MLSFETPNEERLQDAAQFVQLTQTLCYDLTRAKKATNRKKDAHVSPLLESMGAICGRSTTRFNGIGGQNWVPQKHKLRPKIGANF